MWFHSRSPKVPCFLSNGLNKDRWPVCAHHFCRSVQAGYDPFLEHSLIALYTVYTMSLVLMSRERVHLIRAADRFFGGACRYIVDKFDILSINRRYIDDKSTMYR